MSETRILIVEDEFIVASDIESRLLDLGYSVVGKADTGEKGIELARSLTPDLILMDVHLRGSMDGITAATEIRQSFNLPVVFLTAYADESTLERAKDAEPYGYILKPFEDRELRTNIEIAVYKHKAESEIRRLSRLYATLSQVNQAIVRARSREELFPKICEIALEFGRFNVAWIGLLDANTGALVQVAKSGDDVGVVDGQSGNLCECAVESIKQGKPYLIHDLFNKPEPNPCGCGAAMGLRGCAAYPIRLQGQVCGALIVGTTEANFFNFAESRLLDEIALDISFALDSLEVERQRVAGEEALKRREQDLETILATALDGFVVVDTQGRYLEVNDSYCRITGYTREELLHMRVSDVRCAGSREDIESHIQQIMQAGGGRFETLYSSKAGRLLHVEVSAAYQNIDGGRFVCFIHDITQRKLAETALSESESLLVDMGRTAQIGGWVLDASTGEGRWTVEIARIHDLEPKMHPDKEMGIQFYVGSSREQIEAAVEGALEHGIPYDLELQIVSAKGVHKWVRTIGEPIWKDGRVVSLHGSMQDITERKRAEDALRASETRFSKVFHSSPIGINLFRFSDGRSVDVNEAFLQMTGYERAEIIGQTAAELDLFVDRSVRAVWMEKLGRGEAIINQDAKFRRKGGEQRDALGSIEQIDIRGEAMGLVLMSDITERKHMEEELRYRNLILSTQQEVTLDGILVVDKNSKIVSCNQRMLDIWEITASVIEGDDDRKLLQWILSKVADQETFLQRIEYLNLHQEETGQDEIALKDGRVIERYSASLLDAGGRFNGRVWYFRDISERKRSEAALRASEGKFRSYIKNAPFALVVANPEGQIVDFNRATIEVFGYDETTLRSMNVMNLHSEEDQPMALEAIKRLRAEGRLDGEFEMLRQDGTRVSISLRAVLLGDDCSIAFLEDISERKRAEKQMRQLEEQFLHAQKMEAVGRLAGGVAHDFNNLLQVINTYSRFIVEDSTVDARLAHYAQAIQEAGERAAVLTRQLLAFNRKSPLKLQVIQVDASLASMEKMLQRMVGDDIEIISRLGMGARCIKLDPGHLEQIIMNLVVNARDAMQFGGIIRIETTCVHLSQPDSSRSDGLPAGEYLELSVSDTGCGMDAETQKRIFEPFFTTKELGRGTGLGLSTVYGIVRQSDGRIIVESFVGAGTTFKIYLPVVQQALFESKVKKSAAPQRGSETVLIAEDDPRVRTLLLEILEGLGYRVLVASNGRLALQMIAETTEPIHLVISDTVMPEMGGRELRNELRHTSPAIRILLISGYASPATEPESTDKANDQFLSKPFSLQELASKVREVLDMPDCPQPL